MRHVAGNLASRFDHFLGSYGEEPGRDRDAEFADWSGTRAELMTAWDAGWATLFDALDGLSPRDAARTVTIRGEPHTVFGALLRSLSHVSYHAGQIAPLARLAHGDAGWHWLTIPPGGSATHDARTSGTPSSWGAVAGGGTGGG